MNTIAFVPTIDVPLVVVTVAAFIWHFNHWARRRNIETNLDLSGRLPAARLRVILLFVCILALCWTINLAVWVMMAMLLGIGLVVVLTTGGDIAGGAFGLFAAAFIVREWAFGFPHLILHPPRHDSKTPSQGDGEGALLGKVGFTTTSLRPSGRTLIDGVEYSVVSIDGGWVDAGTSVEVTAVRNGVPCVAPSRTTT